MILKQFFNSMNLEFKYYLFLYSKFNTPVLIIGKFIYNVNEQSLRCDGFKFMGTKNSLETYFNEKTLLNVIKMIFWSLIFGISSYFTYKMLRKILSCLFPEKK
jgi:hypothetical protein